MDDNANRKKGEGQIEIRGMYMMEQERKRRKLWKEKNDKK